ncbi:MAG: aminotransferase class I/II-fold pyridoxal phosphate-dependent enzyme [Bacteroidetes bacterium]|jgi:aspartate/methionine/tyrosine aminotransferase|nr:aminotransferase class I/II-fold pyridoxal phosphate-dependent enzyme [Bacteroidota bacterium]
MIQTARRLVNVQEYYFSKKLREIQVLKEAGASILNLGIGSPDLKAASAVFDSLKNALQEDQITQYQSYQGISSLREAIQQFYKKHFNVSLNPTTEILPLMGSKEGIMHISMAFLNQGDEVLIPNPGYPTYTSVTNLIGAKPLLYELSERNDWLPDIKTLEQLDLSKVKLMWLNYPHMPTGARITTEQWKPLIDFGKKHGILLVNDNPYSFILNDAPNSILAIEEAKEIALELNSLSKTFNIAGMRVGMVLGAERYIHAILQVKSQMDSGMFLGIQHGAIAALQLDDAWFHALNDTYGKRRKLVWQIADCLQCTYQKETAGLFVWAKLPHNFDDLEFTDNLLNKFGVFIAPGSIFGSAGRAYIRLSLCASEEVLTEVLNRLNHKN